MKIDIFAHIMTKNWLTKLREINPKAHELSHKRYPACTDLDVRFRLMERYPDVLEVITIAQPPVEELVSSEQAIELAKIANDELAELVLKYPNRFVAAAACISLDDMDAALEETDRAITQLGLKGVQIFTTHHGAFPDDPKLKPLYEKMEKYDMPIWIHPNLSSMRGTGSSGLETAPAMEKVVASGVFQDFPNIKFITHHCGGGIPFFKHRMSLPSGMGFQSGVPNRVEQLQKFYGDTATIGTTALMVGYEFFGADRLLFATDTPLGATFGQTLETIKQVEGMDIPDTDKDKIFTQNAIRLLKLAI